MVSSLSALHFHHPTQQLRHSRWTKVLFAPSKHTIRHNWESIMRNSCSIWQKCHTNVRNLYLRCHADAKGCRGAGEREHNFCLCKVGINDSTKSGLILMLRLKLALQLQMKTSSKISENWACWWQYRTVMMILKCIIEHDLHHLRIKEVLAAMVVILWYSLYL